MCRVTLAEQTLMTLGILWLTWVSHLFRAHVLSMAEQSLGQSKKTLPENRPRSLPWCCFESGDMSLTQVYLFDLRDNSGILFSFFCFFLIRWNKLTNMLMASSTVCLTLVTKLSHIVSQTWVTSNMLLIMNVPMLYRPQTYCVWPGLGLWHIW